MRNWKHRIGTSLLLICAALGAAQAARYRTSYNRAPTIAGTPATTVQEGATYYFKPQASDPDGQRLTFYISNKPAWASFSSRSGRLRGTPSAGSVGTYQNITISVSDGRARASLPPFSISVTGSAEPPAPNSPPIISGSPATSIEAGRSYAFTPTASDPDGDMLAFSITGKPAWATFSTANGTLAGTPGTTQAGNYLNIGISVSDGRATAALPVFSITVTSDMGSASLSWTAPTSNTDGSELRNLAGFRVYHGTSPSQLNEMIQLPGATTNGYVFNQLPRGTHYFAVSAYNSDGNESALSNTGNKAIP